MCCGWKGEAASEADINNEGTEMRGEASTAHLFSALACIFGEYADVSAGNFC